MRNAIIVLLLLLGAVSLPTQTARTHITTGATLPTSCVVGDVWIKTGTGAGPYWCSATNTWTASGGAGGADFTNAGNCQGVVTGVGGQTCRDTTTGALYVHQPAASSNTGWYRLVGPATFGSAGPIVQAVTCDNSSGSPVGWGNNVFNTSNLAGDSLISGNHYCEALTGGSPGGTGGWNTSFQIYYLAGAFDLSCSVRTGSTLTDARLWIGVNTVTLTNSDDSTGKAIMLRYSAGVDSSWVGYTRDGTTASVTAALGTIAINTEYRLRIRYVIAGTPTAYFSVNDGAETTKTTNLPDGTTKAGFFFWVYNKNTTSQHFWYRACSIQFGT